MDNPGGNYFAFFAPKNLIVQPSGLFAKRKSSGSIDTPYTLTAGLANDVSRYLQILYAGQVVLFSEEETTTAEQKWKAIVKLELLTRTWFEDVVSGNLVLDEVVRMLHQGLSSRAAVEVFGDYPGKTLRQILLDFVVEKLEAGDIPPDLYQSNAAVHLLQNAVSELSRRKRSGEERPRQNTKEGMKRYHESLK